MKWKFFPSTSSPSTTEIYSRVLVLGHSACAFPKQVKITKELEKPFSSYLEHFPDFLVRRILEHSHLQTRIESSRVETILAVINDLSFLGVLLHRYQHHNPTTKTLLGFKIVQYHSIGSNNEIWYSPYIWPTQWELLAAIPCEKQGGSISTASWRRYDIL